MHNAWPPTQTQAAARGIKLQVWLVCQIKVPMGNTNQHKKQGSGVFSFLWEAFMLQSNMCGRTLTVSKTITELMQVG